MKRNRHNWNSVDWSKRNGVIAREIGTSAAYVSQRRSIYAPETLDGKNSHPYDWEGIDWAMSNTDIAEVLGISDSYVSYKRRVLRKPPVGAGRLSKYEGTDWSLCNSEIALLLTTSEIAVRQARYRKFGTHV
jgi:hypothetical protein